MSITVETAARVAKLARIKVDPASLPALAAEFSAILGFIAQLNEVDVTGVEPMTSVTPMRLPRRADLVTDGGQHKHTEFTLDAQGLFIVSWSCFYNVQLFSA